MEEMSIASGIILSIIAVFFFTGMEFIFPELNKLSTDERKSVQERIIQFFKQRLVWMAATIQVGKTVAQMSTFYFFAPLIALAQTLFFSSFSSNLFFILLLILVTGIILLLVDVFTRYLVRRSTSPLFYALVIPFGISFIILYPLTWLYVMLVKFITNRMKLDSESLGPLIFFPTVTTYTRSFDHARTETDLELDKKLFRNALEFRNVKVRDCMIPRIEIAAIDMTAGLEKLREVFVESGHSKIIVFRKSIDDVIGYCHSAALFKKPSTLEEILTPIISVPENTLANDLMLRFINENKSLAVVIDEFGGTSGIVSMEDVIEEIFGEIEDEHDEDNLVEQKLDDSSYLFSARLEIDYLNETYKLNLPSGDYDTLAGLILSFTEELPEVGQTIASPPFIFIVLSTTESRIDTVKIVRTEPFQKD